uniref:Uncharacterized protein n=1 Tax=Arundo donax TaxID=35708 RepID=A0A0A9FT37_ARUDO
MLILTVHSYNCIGKMERYLKLSSSGLLSVSIYKNVRLLRICHPLSEECSVI